MQNNSKLSLSFRIPKSNLLCYRFDRNIFTQKILLMMGNDYYVKIFNYEFSIKFLTSCKIKSNKFAQKIKIISWITRHCEDAQDVE